MSEKIPEEKLKSIGIRQTTYNRLNKRRAKKIDIENKNASFSDVLDDLLNAVEVQPE